MEELQDAIEDAQYMDAMLDDAPKPSREWTWLTQIELDKFINKVRTDSPSKLELETICQGSLGLYLVSLIFFRLHNFQLVECIFTNNSS